MPVERARDGLLRLLRQPVQRAAGARIHGADGGHLGFGRSEEHTSELQSHRQLVCRLLLEKKRTGIRPGLFFVNDSRTLARACRRMRTQTGWSGIGVTVVRIELWTQSRLTTEHGSFP